MSITNFDKPKLTANLTAVNAALWELVSGSSAGSIEQASLDKLTKATQDTVALLGASVPVPAADVALTGLEYAGKMGVGMNFGNFLENSYLKPDSQGRLYGGSGGYVDASIMKVLREEGKLTNARIPANVDSRTDANGKTDEAFMKLLDKVIADSVAAGFYTSVGPWHHCGSMYGTWGYEKDWMFKDAVKALDKAGLRRRFVQNWANTATRYKDLPYSVSFSLWNEPAGLGDKNAGNNNLDVKFEGFTMDEYHDMALEAIAAIRATGGRNAKRVIWIETWGPKGYVGGLDFIKFPENDPYVGVQPHIYSPNGYTHNGGKLTGAGLADLREDFLTCVAYRDKNKRGVLVGEFGARETVEDRPEYYSYGAQLVKELGIPISYWNLNSDFTVIRDIHTPKQGPLGWLPNMAAAVRGEIPVRKLPKVFVAKVMTGGRRALSYWPDNWPIQYDPLTGIITTPALTAKQGGMFTMVYPDVPVKSGGIITAKFVDADTNGAQVGPCAVFRNTARKNSKGTSDWVDDRAKVTPTDNGWYGYGRSKNGYTAEVPAFITPDNYLSVDIEMPVGAPATKLRLEVKVAYPE